MWGEKLWGGSFSLICLEFWSSCLFTFLGKSLTSFICKLYWYRAFFVFVLFIYLFLFPDTLLHQRRNNVIFKRMRLLASSKRMKTGRWCLLFTQMKLVCWRADVQAPALPAFSWKGEAKRRAAAAAAAAAVSNIKSRGRKYLPLTDAPTNMSSLRHGSKSYFTVRGRCLWLIQRQESELKFTSDARRHQPESKLHISDIYRASESFFWAWFLCHWTDLLQLRPPVICDVWWQQNWDHRLLLLIEVDDQLNKNSGGDWNVG